MFTETAQVSCSSDTVVSICVVARGGGGGGGGGGDLTQPLLYLTLPLLYLALPLLYLVPDTTITFYCRFVSHTV